MKTRGTLSLLYGKKKEYKYKKMYQNLISIARVVSALRHAVQRGGRPKSPLASTH